MQTKRSAKRTYYVTEGAVYIDVHPHAPHARPGVVFKLIVPPSDGVVPEEFRHWRIETWRSAKASKGSPLTVEVEALSSRPLTESELAWVARHFPELWERHRA